jgi:hypothetical protein
MVVSAIRSYREETVAAADQYGFFFTHISANNVAIGYLGKRHAFGEVSLSVRAHPFSRGGLTVRSFRLG